MLRLTLLIPTHNRSRELVRALESVARQELDPSLWECVVVDNASTDDTAEAVDRFAAAHPALRLRRVYEPRPGVSHARNRGLREATTDLIASIDDDERINPDFLGAYLRFFDEHPAAEAAGGRIIAEYPAGRPDRLSRWTEQPIANPIDLGEAVRTFPAGRLPGGGNMAFRRSTALRYGFATELGRVGDRPIGGEENDFFDRLRADGIPLWYVPGAVMWHIIPPEKVSEAYFRRLAYHIGISQRLRAGLRGGLRAARLRELLKWAATLLLCLTLRPAQSRLLLIMRREISRGIFEKTAKKGSPQAK